MAGTGRIAVDEAATTAALSAAAATRCEAASGVNVVPCLRTVGWMTLGVPSTESVESGDSCLALSRIDGSTHTAGIISAGPVNGGLAATGLMPLVQAPTGLCCMPRHGCRRRHWSADASSAAEGDGFAWPIKSAPLTWLSGISAGRGDEDAADSMAAAVPVSSAPSAGFCTSEAAGAAFSAFSLFIA